MIDGTKAVSKRIAKMGWDSPVCQQMRGKGFNDLIQEKNWMSLHDALSIMQRIWSKGKNSSLNGMLLIFNPAEPSFISSWYKQTGSGLQWETFVKHWPIELTVHKRSFMLNLNL